MQLALHLRVVDDGPLVVPVEIDGSYRDADGQDDPWDDPLWKQQSLRQLRVIDSRDDQRPELGPALNFNLRGRDRDPLAQVLDELAWAMPLR